MLSLILQPSTKAFMQFVSLSKFKEFFYGRKGPHLCKRIITINDLMTLIIYICKNELSFFYFSFYVTTIKIRLALVK
ncbi:hypothetical protein EUGRSUZ_H03494 [Eucalyptus grandis]|uniref:Uncharacterized protein n=2 Tax=Eucalyptus grandis TaxID=71139 RepID=A0ACC3JU69_EUCGR|nr:hypothetical protein EUGRSUZ_H03494 [Eucalyptus grandis]